MVARRGNLITLDPARKSAHVRIRPRKIALIASPWVFDDCVEFRSQQLGLGYIAAYARQFGHEIVAFVDPLVEDGWKVRTPLATKYRATYRFGHSDSWIIDRIPKDVELIGINAPFTDSRLTAYPLIDALKRVFPDIPIVVGGVLATTLPRQVLERSRADVVVKGEGEIAFARIANGEPLESIPGLAFRERDGTIRESDKRSEQLTSVDDIPPPGYDMRPMAEYVTWSPRGDRGRRTLSLISSRGCPFTCEFCSIPEKGQRWRPFGPERIIAEIDDCIERLGINHIEFEDDNFTLVEARAVPILEHLAALRKRGYPVECSFPNGIMIDRLSPTLASLMRAAGTDVAYLPVESGDTRVLVAMDKPNAEGHLAKALEVAKFCVDAGLFVSAFFIVAYPGGVISRPKRLRPEWERHVIRDDSGVYMRGEDEESFETTLGFCHELRALGVQGITPLIATPYPGTDLYDVCERFGWLSYPDAHDVMTTVSYAHMKPEYVQIETPYCSRERAFTRWQDMATMFPAYHNVRRFDDGGLVTTQAVAAKELESQS